MKADDIARSRRVFEQALDLLQGGRTEAAALLCQRAVEDDPLDLNLRALHGAALLKLRRPHDAEAELRRVVRAAPGFAKAHEDLACALLAQGRNEEAVSAFRQALSIDARLDSAWFRLGKALALLGRGAEADMAFERAFELSPSRRALALAAEHQREGRLEEAERIYRDVLRGDPDNVDALRLLALLARKAGAADDAERLLRRALDITPDFVAAAVELGGVLKDQGRFDEAIACLEGAVASEPEDVQAWFHLGATLGPAGRNERAVDAYRRALALQPEHAGALLGLGHQLKTLGRYAEAVAAYRACARLRPDNGEVYWSLANLKTYRFEPAEIEAMQACVEDPDLSEEARIHFCFALGKACDDRREFDRAFAHYERGNAAQRMQVVYDPVQTELVNDRIIEVFDAALFAERHGFGHPDPAPIFIVGMPRSGSTLIEQILASHSQVEGTSELPDLGRLATTVRARGADGAVYPEAVRDLDAGRCADLGREYIERTAYHRGGRAFFIDKNPNNFATIGFLYLILPQAKIIDARRNPLDACVGCFRQLFARGQAFTYDLLELGEYHLQYLRLMAHWDVVLPDRVLRVDYEDMVEDLDAQVRRILAYCGLPWEDRCLEYYRTERAVRTASSEQVRQPVYRGAVGFWRNYERHLGPLIEVLEPVLPARAAD
ncbi:MAG: sulfotransferase [Gammaproteobacteria bacterium]|nr:sulfotransferase [Gammaproteobacteria bacterium]